jgi:hypothetical protein
MFKKIYKYLFFWFLVKKTKTFEERLDKLDLTTLTVRRERGDLIQLFKFNRGIDNIEGKNRPAPAPALSAIGPAANIRGHRERLEPHTCPAAPNDTTSSRTAWNNLSQYVLDARSVNSFKARYDKHAKDRQ